MLVQNGSDLNAQTKNHETPFGIEHFFWSNHSKIYVSIVVFHLII